jgi:hypothetical protein
MHKRIRLRGVSLREQNAILDAEHEAWQEADVETRYVSWSISAEYPCPVPRRLQKMGDVAIAQDSLRCA